jgi:hypothetical protein
MPVTLQDRQDILDLMTGWMHRDLANWDGLAQLFHPDGTIEVTWFEGLAKNFIEGSVKMGKSDFRSKHFIGQPIVRFNGQKAIAETNAMIIVDNAALDLGCVTHNRFYDLVKKRNGAWTILRRQTIYDTGHFTFPLGVAEIDHEVVSKYPREYAALGYLLDKSGFSVKRVFATKAGQLEKEMKQEGEAWLSS